ncbi:MAG: HAD family hydrolase [Thermoproteota archaeon]
MNGIRAIIFDLDNTLIDFLKMKEEACRAAVDAMIQTGLEMTPDAAYRRLMEVYFEVGIESDKAFTCFLEKEGRFKHKTLAAAINAYLDVKRDHLTPYPNTKQTLQELKEEDTTLVVVTDAKKTKAYQRLLAMNLDSYFDFVIGYEDTNHRKQDGTPLRLAIRKLKQRIPDIENYEILMVGDSITRDLKPAKRLGLNTALAKYGQYQEEEGDLDYILTDITDLLKLIRTQKQNQIRS